jgi:hypothetical protein
MAVSLTDSQTEVFQNREAAEQLIDLKSAGESAPRAIRLTERRYILVIEHHASRMRFKRAGNQVHQRRFAGAIGSDERAAGTTLERKTDIARDQQRTEGPV